jgi:hypothetical protein
MTPDKSHNSARRAGEQKERKNNEEYSTAQWASRVYVNRLFWSSLDSTRLDMPRLDHRIIKLVVDDRHTTDQLTTE